MFKNAFEVRKLHPKNLSRCLEDSATLTSSLIPWNSGGAFMFATLGVYPLHYLPFAFMNLANPLVSIIYGYTGFTMAPADAEEQENGPQNPPPSH
jgi:NhaC family Na+:H+ antiporter